MLNREKERDKQKSLRVVSPKLYSFIVEQLQEKHHIHSYDLQMDALPKEEGMEITIRYGETYAHHQSHFFTHEQIDKLSSEIKEFVAKTGEACTEVLIDDYFKIYAP